jgi:hypothetical protein
VAVGGTPFYCKVYDSDSVAVSEIPRSSLGKTVTFAGKLSNAYAYPYASKTRQKRVKNASKTRQKRVKNASKRFRTYFVTLFVETFESY